MNNYFFTRQQIAAGFAIALTILIDYVILPIAFYYFRKINPFTEDDRKEGEGVEVDDKDNEDEKDGNDKNTRTMSFSDLRASQGLDYLRQMHGDKGFLFLLILKN